MTNEQLTEEFIKLAQEQAGIKAKQDDIFNSIIDMKEDIKTTKQLAEDVHIMAINIESMQKTLEATNRKVDEVVSQEFEEFKECKKQTKNYIFNTILGALGIFCIGLITFLIKEYITKGGV